jgi:hypothetical protein
MIQRFSSGVKITVGVTGCSAAEKVSPGTLQI